MRFQSADEYLRSKPGGGPVGVLICEDRLLVEESVAWLRSRGFSHIVAAGPGAQAAADAGDLAVFPAEVQDAAARTALLNRLIAAHRGDWLYIGFNGEFLMPPFAETRSVRDLIEFLWSERRSSIAAYTIDLYADVATADPTFDLSQTFFDAEGWYAFVRDDGGVDVYGGLGWRFEEYAPKSMSRINRPVMFKAVEGLSIGEDLWLSDPTMNTVSCPWHHNPTAALMSVRRAKRLQSHPNFAAVAQRMVWPNSVKFEWRSDQLVACGIIEAGQWM